MPRSATRKQHYNAEELVDAPEHHAYSRALGILTWGTWDHGVRPATQRVADFVSAYPPADPMRYCGGSLTKGKDGTYSPGSAESRLARFLAEDWRAGSLHELLARYGLKSTNGPPREERPFEPSPFRETAQRRNVRLRVLHGAVDIEPSDMDAAKAEFLDRQEKRQAAKDVRNALKRMHDDLADGNAIEKNE